MKSTQTLISIIGTLLSCSFAMQYTHADTVWEDVTIGYPMIIDTPDTYIIRGTVKGAIEVAKGVSCTITGPGTLLRENLGESKFAISGGTNVIVDGLNIQYDKGKAINLGEGGQLLNSTITTVSHDRQRVAGHIQVGVNGLMKDNYAKITDDHFKVKPAGSKVENSTADMTGNGSSITMDYGNSSHGAGHYATNCTTKGWTRTSSWAGDSNQRMNYAALAGATKFDTVSKVHYTDITARNGKDFAHIVKMVTHTEPMARMTDILMTGSVPEGASKKANSTESFSPVTVNAIAGEISDMVVNFGGALSDPDFHYVRGSVSNINIDGVIYGGNTSSSSSSSSNSSSSSSSSGSSSSSSSSDSSSSEGGSGGGGSLNPGMVTLILLMLLFAKLNLNQVIRKT